jgi:hypothetical protein
MAKDKDSEKDSEKDSDKDSENGSDKGKKGKKGKRVKTLGPATIAKPALIGAAVLALVNVALKG